MKQHKHNLHEHIWNALIPCVHWAMPYAAAVQAGFLVNDTFLFPQESIRASPLWVLK